MSVKIYLRKKVSDRISLGHLWIFANEIGSVEGFKQSGETVSVFSSNGSFIGQGYYNPDSKISVRLLTHQPEALIDTDFFLKRISDACGFRKHLQPSTKFIRLVSGEADFLPGFIVDKIQNYLVFQTYTLGMELRKEELISCLHQLFPNYFIYEKNDDHFRKAEQLPFCKGFWGQEGQKEFLFEKNSVQLKINMEQAPRTGLYWEQFLISREIAPFVKDKKVLDAFCYHGFTVFSALKNGAKEAFGIDWSEKAIKSAIENKDLNESLSDAQFYTGNTFFKLKQWAQENQFFDLIILDPPAMSGVQKKPDKALSGYERLLDGAADLLRGNGLLFLAMNGSQNFENPLMTTLNNLLRVKGMGWRIVKKAEQPADHPVLWQMQATQYFRGWLIELFREK